MKEYEVVYLNINDDCAGFYTTYINGENKWDVRRQMKQDEDCGAIVSIKEVKH